VDRHITGMKRELLGANILRGPHGLRLKPQTRSKLRNIGRPHPGASRPRFRASCTLISTFGPKPVLRRAASDSLDESPLVTLNETFDLSPASSFAPCAGNLPFASNQLMLAMTLKVVIADDERLARERLREFLEAEPGVAIVAECTTGTETVLAIQKERPDLLLLDVRMPEMDAGQISRRLRRCSARWPKPFGHTQSPGNTSALARRNNLTGHRATTALAWFATRLRAPALARPAYLRQ
jgi:CheY-like chemotaxis protein